MSLTPDALLTGFSPADLQELQASLPEECALSAVSLEALMARTPTDHWALVCLGPEHPPEVQLEVVSTLEDSRGDTRFQYLIISAYQVLDPFAALVSQDRVFYLSRAGLSMADLGRLICSGLEAPSSAPTPSPAGTDSATIDRAEPGLIPPKETLIASSPETVAHSPMAVAHSPEAIARSPEVIDKRPEAIARGPEAIAHRRELMRRLAIQEEPTDLAELLAEGSRIQCGAQRAHCLLYRAAEDVLVARDPSTGVLRSESAAVGLASFVLRTGTAVCCTPVGEDPRYDQEADDPLGQGLEHFLAVPLTTAAGHRLGVLAVIRPPDQVPFSAGDRRWLQSLASTAAEFFHPPSAPALEEPTPAPASEDSPFRSAALQAHLKPTRTQADPLRLAPGWTQTAYWIILAALLASAVFSVVARVGEYATGTAIVQLGGITELTASRAGVVQAIEVNSGQQVAKGDILLRFHAAQEVSELARIEEELNSRLIHRLLERSPRDSDPAMATLRAEKQRAETRLEAARVRAPHDGVVGDIRVWPGQSIQAGQRVASLVVPDANPSLIVLVPGEFRPLLHPGQPLQLELSGYRYARQKLTILEVDDEVIGPAAAQQLVGPWISDALSVSGPVVRVKARIPGPTFQARDGTHPYHNGMIGTAEIEIRSKRVLFALLPALEYLFER